MIKSNHVKNVKDAIKAISLDDVLNVGLTRSVKTYDRKILAMTSDSRSLLRASNDYEFAARECPKNDPLHWNKDGCLSCGCQLRTKSRRHRRSSKSRRRRRSDAIVHKSRNSADHGAVHT